MRHVSSRVDPDHVAGLLPGLPGTYAATVLEVKAEDKIGATVTSSSSNIGTGKLSVEVHETQLTVVTGIERLDNLTATIDRQI